ncbi:MAG: hypothetical protein WD009_13235, partial [Phycisphaeraceae bacterium]
YALQDANFNVVAIVDDTGSVQERYRYTPYGQRTALNANFTVHNDPHAGGHAFAIGHQGLFHDGEFSAGLIYNRTRMLHSAQGRFVQWLGGLSSGRNPYEYSWSNTGLVMPDGLTPLSCSQGYCSSPEGGCPFPTCADGDGDYMNPGNWQLGRYSGSPSGGHYSYSLGPVGHTGYISNPPAEWRWMKGNYTATHWYDRPHIDLDPRQCNSEREGSTRKIQR